MKGYHMKMPAWLSVAVIVVFSSLSVTAGAQEGRPTETSPVEAGTVPSISPEESERRLQDAMVLFKKGKTDAAIYMLQQVEKADPTNYNVLFKLGEMAIGAKNWAYSIEVLRKASFLRPEDIEVRLILMDIYKAYQMPIQAIVVGKEIVEIDPGHVVATRRLAELYHEQAMQEDEIKMRQQLRRLAPDDYANLKRLAVILDESADLWESAKVYEQIRNYYPDKLEDMRRLAAIYDSLGENFRELRVLDHIAEYGGDRGWMQDKAETILRKQNTVLDPFQAKITFQRAEENTLDVYTVQPEAKYIRIPLRSSINFGVEAKYALIKHRGVGLLDGESDNNSTSVVLSAIQNWSGQDYVLAASAGFLHDDVSGRLFARDNNPLATPADFPFLLDPTFNSYGGTIPIGAVQFTARPGLFTAYNFKYEYGPVLDYDARLSLFTQHKVILGVGYAPSDRTELSLRAENAFVSDGNYRFHGTGTGYYTLWGSSPKLDYRGRRMDFIRQPPIYYIKAGYEIDFFKDAQIALNSKYETFVNGEIRHKGVLIGQARAYKFGSGDQILFNLKLSYGGGTTLTFRRGVEAQLFYAVPDSENQFGISYLYEDDLSTNTTNSNLGIAGPARVNGVSLNVKWQF